MSIFFIKAQAIFLPAANISFLHRNIKIYRIQVAYSHQESQIAYHKLVSRRQTVKNKMHLIHPGEELASTFAKCLSHFYLFTKKRSIPVNTTLYLSTFFGATPKLW